jgi:hypothetical protein
MQADEESKPNRRAEHTSPTLLEGYITEKEYAQQRGVSLRTCQRERALRKAPPHVVLGKQVYYRISAVREWLVRQEKCFEADALSRGKRGRR